MPTIENGGVPLRPDGGMDVTWRLRPGITWHDGKPFTSADVKFTVDAINDPNYNPESTDGFDRISSVDTPDPLTAVVHYREVYAPYALQFVRGCCRGTCSRGATSIARTITTARPLGTGPYRVAEWKTGEYILLERVPHYWRGDVPKIARLLFKFLANTNTRINQLKSGEVHVVATVPWDKHREIAGMPSLVVHQTRGNAYEHVTLNERQFPPFADVRVRRALHARGRSRSHRPHDSRRPRAGHARSDSAGVVGVHGRGHANTRSIRRSARALLDEAGWRDRTANGIRQRDGRPARRSR